MIGNSSKLCCLCHEYGRTGSNKYLFILCAIYDGLKEVARRKIKVKLVDIVGNCLDETVRDI